MKLIKKKKSYTMMTGVELTLADLILRTLPDDLELVIGGETIQIDNDDIFTAKVGGKLVALDKVKITVKIADQVYLETINEGAISDSIAGEVDS